MGKKIRPAAAGLIFCILFAGCGKFFGYLLIDDTASYTRIMFHEMYEQENIDTLLAGSSHCYRSFIPEILEKKWDGERVFNAGTSSQNLDGSYMVIREAVKYHKVKRIYLELYFNMAYAVQKERSDLTQTYIISDYLRPSLDKIRYLLDASGSKHYMNSFILARRNWQKFFDADYVKNLLIKKQTDDYKNYKYTYVTGETEWYAGKGYVANNTVVENWNYFSESGWNRIDVNRISDDWKNSLRNIIAFCDENGIALTLVSAPMPDFLLAGLENYDDYIAFVKHMIADTDIAYYDFNLCREDYFLNRSELFKDADHLNCYGAEAFSRLFADALHGEISKEELFYDSFQEKMDCLKPTVFGISYHDTGREDGTVVRECKIVASSGQDLEYEIVLTPADGEPYLLQEYSDNRFFTVGPDDHGVCTVTYRQKDRLHEPKTVLVSY